MSIFYRIFLLYFILTSQKDIQIFSIWVNILDLFLYNTRLCRKLIMVQAYCVKCRAKRDVKDPVETTFKNGRPAIKGTCSLCGTKVNLIMKKKTS